LGPDDLRNDAAAVDIPGQHDGDRGGTGEAHVGDVARAQIDLGRGAGALNDDEIHVGGERREALQHGGQQPVFQRRVVARTDGGQAPPLHDHLGADIGLGLQEHRVHVRRRRPAGGERLQRLGPADFPAFLGDGRIVRHVLRLERGDPEAAAAGDPAEPGDKERLADVRARPLDHQRGRRTVMAHDAG